MTVGAPGSAGADSGGNGRSGAVPNHVAVIMDGNGRWAREQGMPRPAGHRAGKENIRAVIEAFARHGVGCLTLFAFSTENWDRPEDEVQSLIEILGEAIESEVGALHRQGIRIRHLGRLDRLKPDLQQTVMDSIRLTGGNTRMTLNVAFDYGGRAEILDAVRRIVADRRTPEEITEELFRRYLYTGEDAGPRPRHTDGGGAEAEQLPALAGGLCRVLQHAGAVAGLRRGGGGEGPGRLRRPPPPLRPDRGAGVIRRPGRRAAYTLAPGRPTRRLGLRLFPGGVQDRRC